MAFRNTTLSTFLFIHVQDVRFLKIRNYSDGKFTLSFSKKIKKS